MSDSHFLPDLHESWEDTRATLHAYAHGVSAIPRSHAPAHPKWWHVSLTPTPAGLVTDPVPLPGGGALHLRMDLHRHATVLETSAGDIIEFDMTAGLTGTEFADAYDRTRFESPEPRAYEPGAAETYFAALTNVTGAFRSHAYSLDGSTSPVQHWPHNFDTSVEWFTDHLVTYDEGGEEASGPAQINLGFYTQGRPYFYSNPWPFDADALVGTPLPHGAEWHTDGWEGTILHYDTLAGDPDAARKLAEYAAAVHEVAAPTLTG
jgi:hypothetical protein